MIREALKKDKTNIYELWKHAYPNKAQSHLQFYFTHLFDQGRCVVCEQDNRIISSIHMQKHVMALAGRKLEVSYLSGVATHADYRRRGHMRDLMNSAIDEAKHNHLITLIEAFNPKLYEPFGFEVVYYHKHYHIQKKYLDDIPSVKGVSHSFTAQDLLDVYEMFTKHFDGYCVRNIPYYENFMRRGLLENSNICVYRDKHNVIRGYAYYTRKDKEMKVHEIVYLESIGLMKMLKYICGDCEEVQLEVSQAESLDKIFPLAIPKKRSFLMARVNNFEIFNKLYNSKVKTAKEAFKIVRKPLYSNENF